MTRRRLVAAAVALAIAILVAIVVFVVINAAPGNTEAESGVVGGNGSNLADTSASNGSAVQFSSPAPSGLSMPTLATVGPRCAPTETITNAQALTILRDTGTLSCVTVTGKLTLSGSDGINWVIEDVTFINGGSTYGLQIYSGQDAFTGTKAQRPIFRYIEVRGNGTTSGSGCGAAIYGRNVIIENANIYGCSDGIKSSNDFTLRYSWVHDLDHPDGAHSDAVQIVSGVGQEFYANRFDAYVGYSSDGSMTPDGGTGNGVLQTGSVTNNIQATWTNNWFAGGHYTIRGSTGDGYTVDYTFRNNRFLRFGTSLALGLTNLPPNRYGPLYTMGSHDFDCSNVWDDTEVPLGSC